MLEDIEDDAGLVRRLLARDGITCDLIRVDTREEYVQALTVGNPDIILSDHGLPQFNSVEALQIRNELAGHIPFILVTGSVSEEFAVSSLKHGADDYILKTNLTRLIPAIQHALKQRDLREIKARAEAELQAQNEALKKVNEELDSFVYSVSHNLRAPLLSMQGLLNLARKEDEGQGNAFSTYFNMMDESIVRLDETLKDILAYSRNARNPLESQEVDPGTLIRECFDSLSYSKGFDILEKKTTYDIRRPFFSDKHRIKFIIHNLVSNAVKYMDREKDRCWLHITVQVDEESAVMVFEDNGVGIPGQYQGKIFDMFYRASELSEGAGLGLYIVKEAVAKLNGEIRLESGAGQGSSFTIRLPNEYERKG